MHPTECGSSYYYCSVRVIRGWTFTVITMSRGIALASL